MKKALKTLLAVLVLVSVFALSGCGKKDLSSYAGSYKGEYTKMVIDTEKTTGEEFSVELKSNGTGISRRNGAEYNISWSLNGDNFKMTEKFGPLTIDYNGTLKDGVLDIFNGDKEQPATYEYVYKKQ